MKDPTEAARREMIESGQPYADLASTNKRWNTEELREEFEVIMFLAPFVVVKRKADGKQGILEFTHSPRWYFNWQEDNDPDPDYDDQGNLKPGVDHK